MLYTSGTTGRPKGVPRSHARRARRGARPRRPARLRRGERTLGVMPLYHTMGQRSLLAMSLLGGLLRRCSAEFRAPAALRLIERERLSALYLAPTLFHDLVLAAPDAARRRLQRRKLGYAGAPMTAVLVERVRRRLRSRDVFVNHYGSTEIYTFTIHRDQRAKPGCAGRPGAERAASASSRPTPTPRRTTSSRPARWADHLPPLATRRSRATGTGPTPTRRRSATAGTSPATSAASTTDGDLWLVGRVDDMIISGGENVHPLEVEDVARAPPGGARGRGRRRAGRALRPARRRVRRAPRRRDRRRRSSTRTASPRRRSRASSGRASTASSTTLPKSPSARSCAACCETTRPPTPKAAMTYDGFRRRARRRARRRHDHARRAREDEPGVDGRRATSSRERLRASSARTRRARDRAHGRRRAGLHRRRRHRRLHGARARSSSRGSPGTSPRPSAARSR